MGVSYFDRRKENGKLDLEHQPSEYGRHISYIYRKSMNEMHNRIAQLDSELLSSQYILLSNIYRYEGVNQRALAEMISLDPATVSKSLRGMEEKGYIVRRINEKNRRNFKLYLTEKGRDLAEKSFRIQFEYWNNLIYDFTEQEIETLKRLLKRIELQAYSQTWKED